MGYTIDTTFKKREKRNYKTLKMSTKDLKIRSSHRNSNREGKSQFSIIFVLVSQYRSHSVFLDKAVHRAK